MKSLLSLLLLAAAAAAQEAVNDTAQFLAGLPVRGTALEAFSRDDAWTTHATEFDAAWQALEARQIAKIRAWASEHLGTAFTAREPLFYMFSGPDILYAQTFFPSASTYVLCGLEPVGAVPDIAKIPRGSLPASLAALRKSLNSVLSFSFFITKDMKTDLTQTQLAGTLPVLLVFLARGGCTIQSVEPAGFDKRGVWTASGTKIVFLGPAGFEQTLYYFAVDLSNGGLKSNPGFLEFCDQLGHGACLLKAASYLMHSDEFSAIRAFLLSHSTTILQDDSGIPLRSFAAAAWNLQLFGSYPGPIELFQTHHQPRLVELFRMSHAPQIDFSFGYRWHPRDSTVMLATPRTSIPTAPAATAP